MPECPKHTAGFAHEASRKGAESKDHMEIWRRYVNDEIHISTWLMARWQRVSTGQRYERLGHQTIEQPSTGSKHA